MGDDPIAIPGQQNLTLGSGARAFGMGGAFLARADDATAASWNPAGLSYLRAPELSLVGVYNSFTTADNLDNDSLKGSSVDFAAFTWPVGAGEVSGAVQLSYQRAISFDGTREIDQYGAIGDVDGNETGLVRVDDGVSDGGFDVVALGTGLRLSRHVRAGFTVNRWFNGYGQSLERNLYNLPTNRQRRHFDLDFRPRGWSFNLGLIVSPIETLNLAAVYKTPFTATVGLDRARRDYFGDPDEPDEVTSNAFSSNSVRLDFPSSFGFGLSWRARETLTLSADYTRSDLVGGAHPRLLRGAVHAGLRRRGQPRPAAAALVLSELQYPTLKTVPDPDDPTTPRSSSPAGRRADPCGRRVGVDQGASQDPSARRLLQRPTDCPGGQRHGALQRDHGGHRAHPRRAAARRRLGLRVRRVLRGRRGDHGPPDRASATR